MSHRFDTSFISGAHIFGEPGLGVLAENIPAIGDNGASYLYNDLSFPSDNGKEICGAITTWPASGTLFAYEDGSFTFSGAPDGSYSFQYQLKVDGFNVGIPETVTLNVGSVPVTINAQLGTASAIGYQSAISSNTSIACQVATGIASGLTSSVYQGSVIQSVIGNGVATGLNAAIISYGPTIIECQIGNASVFGNIAMIIQDGGRVRPIDAGYNVLYIDPTYWTD